VRDAIHQHVIKTPVYIYIYKYIYACVCMCVCNIAQDLHDAEIAWENVEHLAEDRPMWRSCVARGLEDMDELSLSNKCVCVCVCVFERIGASTALA